MKRQNKKIYCRISLRRMCNPCGYTMKISSGYHRLLVNDVKRTTKIDGFVTPFSRTAMIGTEVEWKKFGCAKQL